MRQSTAIYASLLFLLLVFGLLIGKQAITGHATAAEVKEQVKDFAAKLPASSVVDDADVCVIIPLGTEEVSYVISKSAGIVTIKDNCDYSPTSNDIAIRFTSYGAFLKNYDDPGNMIKNHAVDYYLLPSKAVQTGGTFSCTEEFKSKYCVANYLYFSKAELQALNPCCADYVLTAQQQARLEQVRPAGFMALLAANFVALSLLFLVLLFIIIFSFIITKRIKKQSKGHEKMNELKTYVSDMLLKGYNAVEIRKSLANSGWTLSQIEEAFK